MLKAASHGAAILVAAQLAAGLLGARVAFLRPVQPLATLAAQELGSVLAAYVAARRAPRWWWLLGLVTTAIATMIWTALGRGDVISGEVYYTVEDLVAGTAHAMVQRLGREPTEEWMTRAAAAYSFAVNVVLCAAGASWAHARARKAARAGAASDATIARRVRASAALWLTTVAAVLVGIFSGRALALQALPHKWHIWIVPDGCVGWAVVDLNVPGAPPLPEEDGYGVIRVPVSGHVQTSSTLDETGLAGYSRNQYWYERDGVRVGHPDVHPYGVEPELFGMRRRSPSERVSVIAFFGSQADLERMREPGPQLPTPGLVGCR